MTLSAANGTPMTFSGGVGELGLTANNGNYLLTLPEITRGGVPPYTYTLTPADQPELGFPRSLSFSGATRKLAGGLDESSVMKKYIYRATDSSGATAEIQFTMQIQPSGPKGLTAFGGQEKVTLTWYEPNDLGIAYWEYQIVGGQWRRVETDKITTSGTPKRVTTVTGLDNGRAYQFRVRATTEGISHAGTFARKTGSWSAIVSGTPTANSRPVISGGGTVNISISELSSVGSDIGNPFSVTDDNRDSIIWRLEGSDAATFGIRKTWMGQVVPRPTDGASWTDDCGSGQARP